MSTVPGRSPSGVRIAGDEYQHLVAWNEALVALRPESDAVSVTVEAPAAGNVDDVVVAYRTRPTKYIQIKHAVDARTPVGAAYLMASSGSASLLERFHRSWNELRAGVVCPDMRLVTDREADPADPAMACLDRRAELLVPDIERPAARAAREAWAEHLGVDEEELLLFLGDLRFMTGRPLAAEIERCDTLMWALGMTTGPVGRDAALGFVRDWVQRRERTIEVHALREAMYERVGRQAQPGALVVVEGIDDDPHPEDADVLIRYVESYTEADHHLRRRFRDPADWKTVANRIEAAADELRRRDIHRAIVRGALRLPAWFVTGAALRHVRGFTVAALQHGSVWASDAAGGSGGLVQSHVSDRSAGTDLVVAVGVATDPTAAVERFVDASGLPAGQVAVILPRHGPGPEAVAHSGTAASMAVAIRDEVRSLLEAVPAERIHLFLATPGGLALLLGHRWNALRPTSVYEHLGVGLGYQRVLEVTS